ncbi:MAG: Uma2 family endonuclease [Candidatus Accumulibacter sp.]|nr:Uma2 family endonuclease [Accumulibacter sp.]
MSTMLEEARESAVVQYHRWSVEEYHRMARSGVLDETDRIELIDGELIDMAPRGCKHAFLVDRLAELLGGGPRASYMVRVQNPIQLGDNSEPQPDISLVTRNNYLDRLPGPPDILLIVEVSDSTLKYDREVKLRCYARHGIPEVWLLDANTGEMTVHREPAGNNYGLIRTPAAVDAIAPLLVPGVFVTPTELLA